MVVDGIYRIGSGEYAGLFLCEVCAVKVAFLCGCATVLVNVLFVFGGCDFFHELMLGGHYHVCRSEEGIGAGGEDRHDVIVGVEFEIDVGADAFSYPVCLQFFYGLRPVKLVKAL